MKSMNFLDIHIGHMFKYQGGYWVRTSYTAGTNLGGDYGACAFYAEEERNQDPDCNNPVVDLISYREIVTALDGDKASDLTKVTTFIEQFEKINLDSIKIKDLIGLYRKIRDKRSLIEKSVKSLKGKEEEIKIAVAKVMTAEEQTSVKTESGQAFFRVSESIVTKDIDAFIEWLQKNPEQMDVLSSKPYVNDKIKQLVGDDEQLPPGLERFRKQEVIIKK